jgi:predicted DCC family thiol-disulfide oxidoreductase YuxK
LWAHGIAPTYTDSLIYITGHRAYTYSDAALQVATHLRAPFRWAKMLRILPKGFRDYLYRWIARNRYTWFGKKDACWLPSPAYNHRFIDGAKATA